MLYKNNGTPVLEKELFQNPTAEYRGTPFWAWNCALEQEELNWQLEVLKQMGFGGAHIHVRTGMKTPYLSDEYMNIVKACVEKAKNLDMLTWLYDEDRWPSGAAGGLVTKDKAYRARYLLFTRNVQEDYEFLIGCYEVELDEEGCLKSWKLVDENGDVLHEKWYAYLVLQKESHRFNDQTYVDTLNKNAIDRFIDITYESYRRSISQEFGSSVPAVFTDEPQFTRKSTLSFPLSKADVILPWTDDLPDTFFEIYGENLVEGIPELIWERADGQISVLRYHYHDHVCERFVTAFADNCGNWCREHGIELTGHVLEEPTLYSQTSVLGEAMRCYRSFGLPGIDMLCARFEYTTAKQAQSVVHQYGREGMLSELYGVTNWDFDFRGHKLHGDWQAALGVTIRVPHLSWVSMAGEAKRDYPASIHYQSPWWEKYAFVEEHFARLNTALTRGNPLVKVGIIHPIESYWLHWGPNEQTALVREVMDTNFQNITKWLLFGSIDFDFISESLLPDLCEKAGAPLKVGEMEYDVILVPECETLRTTTLHCLEQFVQAGGNLIFAGKLPTLADARPSDRGKWLAEKAKCIPFQRADILNTLKQARLVEIRKSTGELTDNLLYQMRQDGEGRWLFVAHGTEPYNKDISGYQDLQIRVADKWKATVYRTEDGKTEEIAQYVTGNVTEIQYRLYDYDSLLLWLEPWKEIEGCKPEKEDEKIDSCREVTGHRKISVPKKVSYTLSEPNVCLLDMAEYALDNGEWQSCEEILRLDNICRKQLGWPSRKNKPVQPWALTEQPVTHVVHLRWHIMSDIACENVQLAIEDAEQIQLKWNGQEIDSKITGWYVDKSIKTVTLGNLNVGDNILEAAIPFGRHTNVEWVYLLGEFGVQVYGKDVRIVQPPKELAFGNLVNQGFPFYGGNVTYHIPIETKGSVLRVRSGCYRGALQTINLDGKKEIPIIYPPYAAEILEVREGTHVMNLTLYGHRRNSFGPVHLTDLKEQWIGPMAWRSEGEKWCYEYMLCEEGVMTAPEITELGGLV
ncbi:MAG: hypothetical protein IJZ34_10490 [Lachnospiraceae bacterium]|nr:hypothetical protein [Lachnospiraceae bacterium]